ncbi:hypothetical protein [Streptomyces sp. NPDC052015]|uniref:hypothetical protein n=1 Tax=Streptomyces sp. NPDC052015 TaxID=3154755 RepID=UPI00341815EA
MRRFLAALSLAAALLLAGAPVAARPAAASPDVLVTEGDTRFALVSCVLRNTGSGWTVINDSGHTPSGCTGLVTHPDHLELQHAVGAVRVSSLTVTVDETYAQAGLRVGASVGFSISRIYLYSGAPGGTALDPATVAAATGNLWVYGLFRV